MKSHPNWSRIAPHHREQPVNISASNCTQTSSTSDFLIPNFAKFWLRVAKKITVCLRKLLLVRYDKKKLHEKQNNIAKKHKTSRKNLNSYLPAAASKANKKIMR